VKAVGTVGAGDVCAGAYLDGITDGLSRKQAGDLAAMASAKLVSSLGPRLVADQTQALLKEFQQRQ
jgi:sugar/nucleoside kinase (ribokinase family)